MALVSPLDACRIGAHVVTVDQLRQICRFCGKWKPDRRMYPKSTYETHAFYSLGVDITTDDAIHPPRICETCRARLYNWKRRLPLKEDNTPDYESFRGGLIHQINVPDFRNAQVRSKIVANMVSQMQEMEKAKREAAAAALMSANKMQLMQQSYPGLVNTSTSTLGGLGNASGFLAGSGQNLNTNLNVQQNSNSNLLNLNNLSGLSLAGLTNNTSINTTTSNNLSLLNNANLSTVLQNVQNNTNNTSTIVAAQQQNQNTNTSNILQNLKKNNNLVPPPSQPPNLNLLLQAQNQQNKINLTKQSNLELINNLVNNASKNNHNQANNLPTLPTLPTLTSNPENLIKSSNSAVPIKTELNSSPGALKIEENPSALIDIKNEATTKSPMNKSLEDAQLLAGLSNNNTNSLGNENGSGTKKRSVSQPQESNKILEPKNVLNELKSINNNNTAANNNKIIADTTCRLKDISSQNFQTISTDQIKNLSEINKLNFGNITILDNNSAGSNHISVTGGSPMNPTDYMNLLQNSGFTGNPIENSQNNKNSQNHATDNATLSNLAVLNGMGELTENLTMQNVNDYVEKHQYSNERDEFELIAEQRLFIKVSKDCYSYFEKPKGSSKCIQITVLVNDRKKTWKAFLNGQRIQHVNVSENESIPDYLSIADFDSLLEHLVLISPDTLMTNYEGGIEKKNDGNRHLLTLLNDLQSERRLEMTKYRSLERMIKRILTKQAPEELSHFKNQPKELCPHEFLSSSSCSSSRRSSVFDTSNPMAISKSHTKTKLQNQKPGNLTKSTSKSGAAIIVTHDSDKTSALATSSSLLSNANLQISSDGKTNSGENIPISASAAAGLHSNVVSGKSSSSNSKSSVTPISEELVLNKENSNSNSSEVKPTKMSNKNDENQKTKISLKRKIQKSPEPENNSNNNNNSITKINQLTNSSPEPLITSEKLPATDSSNISGGSSSGVQMNDSLLSGGNKKKIKLNGDTQKKECNNNNLNLNQKKKAKV